MVMREVFLCAESLRVAGVRHGFSTRYGGVSEGPYATLNLGVAREDLAERVRENHRRLAEGVGYDVAKLHWRSQVHGGAVHEVGARDEVESGRLIEADGLVAHTHGTAVAVRVADCVPVLLAEPETGRVAAVHAGWRGVVAGVVERALEVMSPRTYGSVLAALGPSIGGCCFEVGAEVAREIVGVSGEECVIRRGERPRVDLRRAIEVKLSRLGVTQVERVGGCTVCDRESFYSFRRDGAHSGRMLGVIVAGVRPLEREERLG